MSELERIIQDKITADGPMSVAVFMTLALSHPEYGYYVSRDPFGVDGDFTTAPEISQMFGEMIGAWICDTAINQIDADRFNFFELGPGRGTLMSDALRVAKNVPGFLESSALHLLEMSPVLREKQKQALGEYSPVWHGDLSSVPSDKPLIILANEFLDALPVRHLVWRGEAWRERLIDVKDGAFVWVETADVAEDVLAAVPPVPVAPKEGDILEVSPERLCFMRDLFGLLKKARGVALFIDYGYARPAYGESLQALYKHAFCGVFEHVGDADLTAHVDFAGLQDLVQAEGLECFGVVPQGAFLKRLGIDMRAATLKKAGTPEQARDVEKALHRLTDSGEMGELFKVMGFGYGTDGRFAGF